jgi:hypothetical protein
MRTFRVFTLLTIMVAVALVIRPFFGDYYNKPKIDNMIRSTTANEGGLK